MEKPAGGSPDPQATARTVPATTDRNLRAFLFADIRGYSTFNRERGDEAAALLAKTFADLARDAVEARSGRVPAAQQFFTDWEKVAKDLVATRDPRQVAIRTTVP
jgi:class 3 adenylate cyclase